jgi:uncharacterized protein
MENITKSYITWSKVETYVDSLAKLIEESPIELPETIYGVARGGLIPAVMLSHRLGLPLITNKELINEKTLIVDDIVDSGHTIKEFTGCLFASLVFKPHTSAMTPTYFAYSFKEDKWMVFPWERKNSKTIVDRKL